MANNRNPFLSIVLPPEEAINSAQLREAGELSAAYLSGEAFVVLDDLTKVYLKEGTYRDIIDILQKNKILTNSDAFPTPTPAGLKNRKHMYRATDASIPAGLYTYSIHKVIIEREFIDGYQGEAKIEKVTYRRVSERTLAKDVEIEDYRKDVTTGVKRDVVYSFEDLFNYTLNLPFDKDSAISADTNRRLGTNENDKSVNSIKIRLNTLDNPIANSDATKNTANYLLTGPAGKEIKEYLKTSITDLRGNSTFQFVNYEEDGTHTALNVNADSNNATLKLKATELAVDNNLFIIQVDIANRTVTFKHHVYTKKDIEALVTAGQVTALTKIITDSNGNTIDTGKKDFYPNELLDKFYNKTYYDANYLDPTSSAEVMKGSLKLGKNLTAKQAVTVTGDMKVTGGIVMLNTVHSNYEDPIITVGNFQEKIGAKFTTGNDVLLAWNELTKQIELTRSSVDSQNVITTTGQMNLRAKQYKGEATEAGRFKNALTLTLAKELAGTVSFYGNEGVSIPAVNLIATKATDTVKYGMVKTIKTFDTATVVPVDFSKVFNAQSLAPHLDYLREIGKKTTSPSMDSSEVLASSAAIADVNRRLDFFVKTLINGSALYPSIGFNTEFTLYKNNRVVVDLAPTGLGAGGVLSDALHYVYVDKKIKFTPAQNWLQSDVGFKKGTEDNINKYRGTAAFINGLMYFSEGRAGLSGVELSTRIIFDGSALSLKSISFPFELTSSDLTTYGKIDSDKIYDGCPIVDTFILKEYTSGGTWLRDVESFSRHYGDITKKFWTGKKMVTLNPTYRYKVVKVTTFKEISSNVSWFSSVGRAITDGRLGDYTVPTYPAGAALNTVMNGLAITYDKTMLTPNPNRVFGYFEYFGGDHYAYKTREEYKLSNPLRVYEKANIVYIRNYTSQIPAELYFDFEQFV